MKFDKTSTEVLRRSQHWENTQHIHTHRVRVKKQQVTIAANFIILEVINYNKI